MTPSLTVCQSFMAEYPANRVTARVLIPFENRQVAFSLLHTIEIVAEEYDGQHQEREQ